MSVQAPADAAPGAGAARLRIAMYSDNFHPEVSGIADSIATVARALAARGHRVHVVAPRYAERDYRMVGLARDEAADAGGDVEVTRLPSLRYPTGTAQGRIALPAAAAWRAVRAFAPDVVHVHLPFSTGLGGAWTARALGAPLVGTNHTPLGEYVRYGPARGRWARRLADRYAAWFYRRCDLVTSPARAILDHMGAALGSVPSAVVPNPVRLDAFGPLPGRDALKRELGFAPFTVLYAGRLAPEKGVDRVIRAFARLCRDAPDAGLALAGAGAARRDLEALCRTLGIEQRVRFLGFVAPAEALARVYNAADAFVIAGSVDTQCLGAMQAMACGLPVVASRAWGVEEYVGPTNGVLVEPGDDDALHRALADLRADPTLRARLGAGGRETAATLSAPAIAGRWEAIYRRMTTAPARRATRPGARQPAGGIR